VTGPCACGLYDCIDKDGAPGHTFQTCSAAEVKP
jgi:hypothetical protein